MNIRLRTRNMVKLVAGGIAAVTLSTSAWAAGITYASDLHQDGRHAAQAGKAIVALVSASDCGYCELLKNNVLVGMEHDQRIILREIGLDVNQTLIDFDGNVTDHQSFAAKRGLSFTPTVLFLDGTGGHLADAIVGVANIHYYGFYLEKRIEQSLRMMNDAAVIPPTAH